MWPSLSCILHILTSYTCDRHSLVFCILLPVILVTITLLYQKSLCLIKKLKRHLLAWPLKHLPQTTTILLVDIFLLKSATKWTVNFKNPSKLNKTRIGFSVRKAEKCWKQRLGKYLSQLFIIKNFFIFPPSHKLSGPRERVFLITWFKTQWVSQFDRNVKLNDWSFNAKFLFYFWKFLKHEPHNYLWN